MKYFLFLAAVTFSGVSFSAITPSKPTATQSKQEVDAMINSTVAALRLPTQSRIESLTKLGPAAYKGLIGIAFDENYGMKMQWRALTTMAMIGKKNAVPEIERALGHKEWYLRNAALIVMSDISSKLAVNWARKLMSDPSLIVRTEAVGVIRKHQDYGSRELLWKKLYDKQNFRGKQSLWVRRHIVETLSEMGKSGEQNKFVKILDDNDTTLYPAAIAALEKLSKKHLGEPHDNAVQKAKLWKNWFAKTRT